MTGSCAAVEYRPNQQQQQAVFHIVVPGLKHANQRFIPAWALRRVFKRDQMNIGCCRRLMPLLTHDRQKEKRRIPAMVVARFFVREWMLADDAVLLIKLGLQF